MNDKENSNFVVSHGIAISFKVNKSKVKVIRPHETKNQIVPVDGHNLEVAGIS